ncbi:MAG: metallopeptidase family protein [bacterium]
MIHSEFEKLVNKSLKALPKHIREKMNNVAIIIEKGSPRGSLLGLYEGVPKIAWNRGFGMNLPDKITIFQKPLERMANSPEELKEIVKNTVWHEVAHHFGFDEKGIRDLEKRRKNEKT